MFIDLRDISIEELISFMDEKTYNHESVGIKIEGYIMTMPQFVSISTQVFVSYTPMSQYIKFEVEIKGVTKSVIITSEEE